MLLLGVPNPTKQKVAIATVISFCEQMDVYACEVWGDALSVRHHSTCTVEISENLNFQKVFAVRLEVALRRGGRVSLELLEFYCGV